MHNYSGVKAALAVKSLKIFFVIIFLGGSFAGKALPDTLSWIRVNQLGYNTQSIKIAVWVSKNSNERLEKFQLVDASNSKVVFESDAANNFGKYGPFLSTYRLNFTAFKKEGTFFLRAGKAVSPSFRIGTGVYKGTADFTLRYMRQQRSGYNPFLNDSCHTNDGYIIYGPSSEHIDVAGGWHDATDYLQYVTTSANATYHLLAAYRDFAGVFSDSYLANGREGNNGQPDVLDEARWGLDWLVKMHPRPDWMFNQLADDRDHAGFRLPNKDSVDYGWGQGKGRPVYFLTGEVQGLGKYKNRATGTASTAGKFSSAFALGASLYTTIDSTFAQLLKQKSLSAYAYGLKKPGVSQTAPNTAPYFYEEDNWVDDMELASAALYKLTGNAAYLKQSLTYSKLEQVTPWMGADTARHYQWYPFHNFGHYELAVCTKAKQRALLISYYKQGIERVWQRAKKNGFYRGIPFIWCSNNLTTSFTIQCYLYRKLSGDLSYIELEQACFDWLFACNPWGKSMVYGMPADGDTPSDPHSSLSHLYKYPLDGALIDGPVYTSIFKNLKGLELNKEDRYAPFQSDLAVYHDDFGDFSTNEPTMDGTASLTYLLAARESEAIAGEKNPSIKKVKAKK